VSEDWPAVAQAIGNRMAELGISQRELIERSHLSKAVVREVQHNVVQRRRSTRTLEALSTALDWHPGHLAAVLANRRPPRAGEPLVRSDEDIAGRLTVIEDYVRGLADRPDDVAEIVQELKEIKATVGEILNRVARAPDSSGG
jgi:transcriptional regulator with XRE-family HTH domain